MNDQLQKVAKEIEDWSYPTSPKPHADTMRRWAKAIRDNATETLAPATTTTESKHPDAWTTQASITFLGVAEPAAIVARLRASHDVAEEAAQLIERLAAAVPQRVEGDLARVTIEGQVWVREPAPETSQHTVRDFSKIQIDSNFYMTWPSKEIEPGRFADVDPATLGPEMVLDIEEKYLVRHLDAECGLMAGDIEGSFHRIREALAAQRTTTMTASAEPVAWIVERERDRTFPHFYRTEAEAQAMLDRINVNPAATKHALVYATPPSDAARKALVNGCCSATSPCAHQKKSPATLCEVCQQSADRATAYALARNAGGGASHG
jgi:hypothetical protein